MKKFQLIVYDIGRNMAKFFGMDLQNLHYLSSVLLRAKKDIGNKEYQVDKEYENRCIDYWKRKSGHRISTLWHNYYSYVNGIRDVRYIPENLYYAYIEPYLNRKELAKSCDDKCYYTERFPKSDSTCEFRLPPIVLRNVNGMYYDKDFNLLDFNSAVLLLESHDKAIVIKESISGMAGQRITFVDKNEDKSDLSKVLLKYKKDFVVQDVINQCDELKALNPSSVNTIRFITLLCADGVHVLSSVLRIGGLNSRVDNFMSGGIACGIDNKGVTKSVGYNHCYEKYSDIHPNGIRFSGVSIPSYNKARELVKKMHVRFGHFRIISWDIAIGEDYIPIIIEFNLTPQSIDLHQINNGPLFGEFTDKVLEEVFKQ